MEHTMTASQCLKHQILLAFWLFNDEEEIFELTGSQIDEMYSKMDEKEHALFEEAKEKIRTEGFQTKIAPKKDEKYNSFSIATETHDHKLIGWTCFYGPMHSRPDTVDWVEDAYFVHEEKIETITYSSKFSKA